MQSFTKLIRGRSVCCRGDPGRRGGTAARELRRQPGRRLRALQWVWRVQKGKSPILLFAWASQRKIWQHVSCDVLLCLFPVLVLHSTSLSSVLLWKEHLRSVCFTAVWGTICYWLIWSRLGKQSRVYIYINPMLLDTNLHQASLLLFMTQLF